MKRLAESCLLALAGILIFLLSAGGNNAVAGTVHGTVINGTTGKPASGVEVILIQLQGGMEPIANTKTDAQGAFTFDNPGLGAQPMLLRAVFRGVNFHEPAPPGRDTVSINVYEPTADSKTIEVPSHIIIFQPNGNSLTVGEEYSVHNKSNPPQAYFAAAGNFQFALPENAQLKQIAAAGPAGMPVIQAPIDKGKNRYAIAYAFHPGDSDIRVAYDLPYPNDAATVKIPTTYGGGRLLVVAPPTVSVTGDGLQAAGQEQGMNIYQRASVATSTVVAINLSGTAPPPSADNSGDAGSAGGSQGQSGDSQASSGAAIQVVPGRLDSLKWPLVIGFVFVFGLAAYLLSKKQVAVTIAGPAVTEHDVPAAPARQKHALAASPAAVAPSPAPTMAAMDSAAGRSLDALKDQIFRLELRRQAGTISEEEYARERAKAEQVLRDLVRG
jgi:hypothetical protein